MSWSSNDEKIMQLAYLIVTYAYGLSRNLVSEKIYIKCNNIIKKEIDYLWWCSKRKHKRT